MEDAHVRIVPIVIIVVQAVADDKQIFDFEPHELHGHVRRRLAGLAEEHGGANGAGAPLADQRLNPAQRPSAVENVVDD
jgi:hypothetical protein